MLFVSSPCCVCVCVCVRVKLRYVSKYAEDESKTCPTSRPERDGHYAQLSSYVSQEGNAVPPERPREAEREREAESERESESETNVGVTRACHDTRIPTVSVATTEIQPMTSLINFHSHVNKECKYMTVYLLILKDNRLSTQ